LLLGMRRSNGNDLDRASADDHAFDPSRSRARRCTDQLSARRHWDVRTPSSDSARLSQLPCFGV
jgi:hypothetical protein